MKPDISDLSVEDLLLNKNNLKSFNGRGKQPSLLVVEIENWLQNLKIS
jgi:hypothetical protein